MAGIGSQRPYLILAGSITTLGAVVLLRGLFEAWRELDFALLRWASLWLFIRLTLGVGVVRAGVEHVQAFGIGFRSRIVPRSVGNYMVGTSISVALVLWLLSGQGIMGALPSPLPEGIALFVSWGVRTSSRKIVADMAEHARSYKETQAQRDQQRARDLRVRLGLGRSEDAASGPREPPTRMD